MAAYVQWKGSLCDGCGVEAALGYDEHTAFSITDEDCWGCRLKSQRERQLQNEFKEFPNLLDGKRVWISDARPNGKVVTDGE
jgi:hypothetical protein